MLLLVPQLADRLQDLVELGVTPRIPLGEDVPTVDGDLEYAPC